MSDFLTPTSIPDLWIYRPRVFKDSRGAFFESYNAIHLKSIGVDRPFVQDNRSLSQKGTLRGLHMQSGKSAQTKIVSVLKGRVYDVAVDLRPQSSTFKKWFGMELSDEEQVSLIIPKGFAHGFVVLSETAEFFYKVDAFYDKTSEQGIVYNDKDLAISWPVPEQSLILSDKDRALSTFQDWYRSKMENK